VNRGRAGAPRRPKDSVDVQIAFRCGSRTDANGVIGLGHEGRVAVSFGENGHAFQPQLPAGALDPAGDLAPVGDKDAGEAQVTRHEGVPLFRKLLIPSMPSSVSQASAKRSAV
jgi:hypothetical protein